MTRFQERWNRFWFEPRSTQSLCLFRIFFGLAFLMKMTGFNNLQRVGELRARFPRHLFVNESDYYLSAFRLPVPGFEWLPVPEFWQYQLLEHILFFAGIFLVAGLFTRAASVSIAGIWTYMFLLSQFTYRHHVMLFALAMIILAFSRCDEHYSISAYLRGKKAPRPPRMFLPVRLLQVALSIIYLFSFSGKLNPSWFSGDIMLIFYDQGSISGDLRDGLDWLFAFPALEPFKELSFRSLAWFTLVVEGFLAFGFWIPRLRFFAILSGVMLHLGIDMTMAVVTFSFQMLAMYIVFIQPEAGQHRAFYDGSVARAGVIMRWCRLLDWFQRITWIDVNESSGSPPSEVPDFDSSKGKIAVISSDGRLYRGYAALAWLASRFPLTFLPSWLFFWAMKSTR